MGKKIIPEAQKQNYKHIVPIEEWTESVQVFIANNGNAPVAYQDLKSKGIDYGYRRFLDLVHNGDPVRQLPSILNLYVASLQKTISRTKASMNERIQKTLELTDLYKEVLVEKVKLLQQDPDQVTRNIGNELRGIYDIEHRSTVLLNESEEKSKAESATMSLAQAKEKKAVAMKALASRATSDNASDDYGLSNVIKIKAR